MVMLGMRVRCVDALSAGSGPLLAAKSDRAAFEQERERQQTHEHDSKKAVHCGDDTRRRASNASLSLANNEEPLGGSTGSTSIRRKCASGARRSSTIKARMGATHFLMKTLPRVAAEMTLHVLAYNLTRVMNIMASSPFLTAMRA